MTGSPASSRSTASAEYLFLPGVVAPAPPTALITTLNPGAGDPLGMRVVCPASGTLVDLAILVTVESGNVDVGVYDTAATRAQLFATGSIACPAVGWQIVGDPNIAVDAGEQLDFVFLPLGATGTFGAHASQVGATQGALPAGYLGQVAAAPKIMWRQVGAALGALPATFAEGDLSASQFSVTVIGRIE